MFIAFHDVITKFDCNGYELNCLTFPVFKNSCVLTSVRGTWGNCSLSVCRMLWTSAVYVSRINPVEGYCVYCTLIIWRWMLFWSLMVKWVGCGKSGLLDGPELVVSAPNKRKANNASRPRAPPANFFAAASSRNIAARDGSFSPRYFSWTVRFWSFRPCKCCSKVL